MKTLKFLGDLDQKDWTSLVVGGGKVDALIVKLSVFV